MAAGSGEPGGPGLPGGFVGAAATLVVAGYKCTVKQADGGKSLRLAMLLASRSTPEGPLNWGYPKGGPPVGGPLLELKSPPGAGRRYAF